MKPLPHKWLLFSCLANGSTPLVSINLGARHRIHPLAQNNKLKTQNKPRLVVRPLGSKSKHLRRKYCRPVWVGFHSKSAVEPGNLLETKPRDGLPFPLLEEIVNIFFDQ